MKVSKRELYDDISERIRVTTSTMEENGYDGLLVYGNTETHGNLRYLTDFAPAQSTTLVNEKQERTVSDGAALLLLPDGESRLLLEPGLIVPREVHTDNVVAGGWDPDALALTADSLVEILREEGLTDGVIGVETWDRFPHPLYAGVTSTLSDVELVESRIVENQRMTKTDVELAILREACELAEKSHEIVVEELRDYEGKTELDIVHAVESRLLDENPEYTTRKGPAYVNSDDTIGHGSYHHARASKELEEGTVFTWDLPQHYRGYYVDTSRTRVIGEPTAEQQNAFEAARHAYDEVVEMAKPGVNAMDLVERYHDILDEHGFEPPFGGLLGHGVGLELHERPDLVLDELTLERDMVVAIEPRASVDEAVIGLEDMIRVTESGGEPLTGFERDELGV